MKRSTRYIIGYLLADGLEPQKFFANKDADGVWCMVIEGKDGSFHVPSSMLHDRSTVCVIEEL